MERFSMRNGLYSIDNMSECSGTTRRRIWQVFAKKYVLTISSPKVQYDIVEDILAYFGCAYEYSISAFDHGTNCNILKNYICEKCEWYKVYDFVEYHISHDGDYRKFIDEYNKIFEDEKTGYHIIGKMVTPITNGMEIDTIENSLVNSPEHVTPSIEKAIRLFSDRENPDYNNAIKEAITAVEALCCTMVEGKEDTLGKAINKMAEQGIVLHEALSDAIKKLYKYTCNEDGKRHGGTTYVESDVEDARFMLVTCSAIINYLMVKWEKAKGGIQ